MPIYTYECPHCKKEFDLIMSINKSQDVQLCPCGEVAKKVIKGGHSFSISGEGVYKQGFNGSKKEK